MSSLKEEPGEYKLHLIPKGNTDLLALTKHIKKERTIGIYIEVTIAKLLDYIHGEKDYIAEILITKGE